MLRTVRKIKSAQPYSGYPKTNKCNSVSRLFLDVKILSFQAENSLPVTKPQQYLHASVRLVYIHTCFYRSGYACDGSNLPRKAMFIILIL